MAVWSGMAIGGSLATGAAWPLLVGALAVANRDFIYVVVLLACFGRAQRFLVLVALGTPIFMRLVRCGAGRRRIA